MKGRKCEMIKMMKPRSTKKTVDKAGEVTKEKVPLTVSYKRNTLSEKDKHTMTEKYMAQAAEVELFVNSIFKS